MLSFLLGLWVIKSRDALYSLTGALVIGSFSGGDQGLLVANNLSHFLLESVFLPSPF